MSDIIEDNDKLLKAWNEWKEICSIIGCSDENKERLKKIVRKAFENKLSRVLGKDARSFAPDDCAAEFDNGIFEKAEKPGIDRRTGKERVKKNYKDFVWNSIVQSSDPPLKIINGLLIGSKGIINDIVINYLKRERGFKSSISEDGKRILVHPISIDMPFEGKDGSQTNFENFINNIVKAPDANDLDREFIAKSVPEVFTAKMAAVLLAKAADITLEERSLQDFLGVGKSQAYELQKTSLMKLAAFFVKNGIAANDENAMKLINIRLFSIIQSEKGAKGFLSLLKTKGISYDLCLSCPSCGFLSQLETK